VAKRTHWIEWNGQLQAFSGGFSLDSVERVRTVAVELRVFEGEDFGCEGVIVCVLDLRERALMERDEKEVEIHLMKTIFV
jgi:hypothetical protein